MRSAERKPRPADLHIFLYLINCDLGKTLTVALFAFVLLAAFLFEDDDLVGLAVAYDRGLNAGST